jgi:small subunit ribosomal protein S2
MLAELEKLEYNLGGVRDMKKLPQAVVMVDLKTEEIALREAERLRIPIIGLVDSNVDPGPVQFPVPGNDDAIRSCNLFVGAIGEAVEGAAANWREAEAKRRAEEEERKRQEEERKRKEAEEKAAREAEVKAKLEAEEAETKAAAEDERAAAAKKGAPAKEEEKS